MKTNTKENTLQAAMLMLGANGKTSTLEVKTLLRAAGFMANQQEVSEQMDELFNEEKFDREMNPSGLHWDYIPLAPEPVDDSNGQALVQAQVPAQAQATQAARTKAQPYSLVIDGLSKRDIASKLHSDDWIAFNEKIGKHVAYPKDFTRDKCRASFSRINGVPYSDVRCQTVSHFTRGFASSVTTIGTSIKARVIDIIVEKLGVDPEEVTMDANFVDDLGTDDLDTVELVMEFEKEFNIAISDDQADGFHTVGQAIDFLEKNSK